MRLRLGIFLDGNPGRLARMASVAPPEVECDIEASACVVSSNIQPIATHLADTQ